MKQLISLILTLVIAFGLCACASDADSETTTAFTQGIASDEGSDSLLGESEIGAFRPVDCTIPALSVYDYPFLGLTVTLPQSLLDAINARELAKVLHERSNANFPFLIADDGNLNGRLIGIESIPESFFVDSNGNIVSEPYVGARSEADWATIVDAEFSALAGNA